MDRADSEFGDILADKSILNLCTRYSSFKADKIPLGISKEI